MISDSSKADPGASSTTAVIASPNFSSGSPTATASATAEWVFRTSSTSSGYTFSPPVLRSEEHTSELQSLMRNSYAVFCLKKKNNIMTTPAFILPQQQQQ